MADNGVETVTAERLGRSAGEYGAQPSPVVENGADGAEATGSPSKPETSKPAATSPRPTAHNTPRPASARPASASTPHYLRQTTATAAKTHRDSAEKEKTAPVSRPASARPAHAATTPQPFKLSTNERAQRPVSARMADSRPADQPVKPASKASVTTPRPTTAAAPKATEGTQQADPKAHVVKPVPFKLASMKLHEKAEADRKKRIQEEAEKEAKAREFKARPRPKYPLNWLRAYLLGALYAINAAGCFTPLSSQCYAAASSALFAFEQHLAEKEKEKQRQRDEEERQKKLAEEEELKKLRESATYKAHPAPKFNPEKVFKPAPSKAAPTVPESPRLLTASRSTEAIDGVVMDSKHSEGVHANGGTPKSSAPAATAKVAPLTYA
eukprot:jgi/Chlat1/7476/Chrsp6S07473